MTGASETSSVLAALFFVAAFFAGAFFAGFSSPAGFATGGNFSRNFLTTGGSTVKMQNGRTRPSLGVSQGHPCYPSHNLLLIRKRGPLPLLSSVAPRFSGTRSLNRPSHDLVVLIRVPLPFSQLSFRRANHTPLTLN